MWRRARRLLSRAGTSSSRRRTGMSDNMTGGQEWREGMAAINPIRTTGFSAPPACEPSSTRPILLSRHQIEPQDIEAVTAMLKSGEDLTRGRQTRAFEEEFAAYAGARYAVACSSGTAALWLAAQACSVISGPWQVPAITFAATRNALDSFEIVDCDPDTGLGKFTQDPALAVMYAGQTAGGGGVGARPRGGGAGGKSPPLGTGGLVLSPPSRVLPVWAG